MYRRIAITILRLSAALLVTTYLSMPLPSALVSEAWAFGSDQYPDDLLDPPADPWDLPDPEDELPDPQVADPFDLPDLPPFPPDDEFDSLPDPIEFDPDPLGYAPVPPAVAQPVFSGDIQSINRFDNTGGSLQPGEPTVGGRMHATGWAEVKAPKARRVVIQTFGSDMNTVLAAYTGAALNALKRVAVNDDFPVTGVSAAYSLISFAAAANALYHIQFGSRSNATADILFNTSVLPAAGGLSAFLTHQNGVRTPIGDYVCGYHDPILTACANPRFVLYNSTAHAMRVTSSNDLGAGVVSPSPVTIQAGHAVAVEFSFNASFDKTTVRSVAGHFTFIGRDATKIAGRSRHRALIVVKPASTPPDVLQVSIRPRVRAGILNQWLPFKVTVGNAGTRAAIGCTFHSYFNSAVKVEWGEISPNTNRLAHTLNAPAIIHAKRSRTFIVWVAGQEPRIADPTFVGTNQPFAIDCANTRPATITLRTAFDVTARIGYLPMRVSVATIAPKTSRLDVPATGATYRLALKNAGPAGTIVALPSYVAPFTDAANTKFTAKICQTQTASSGCLQPVDFSVQFAIPKGATRYILVSVRRPAADPGYDFNNRRLFVRFNEVQPFGFVYSVPVAARSIAVRRR